MKPFLTAVVVGRRMTATLRFGSNRASQTSAFEQTGDDQGCGRTLYWRCFHRFGCKLDSGKSSEITIYRAGAKILILDHHGRNEQVAMLVVKGLRTGPGKRCTAEQRAGSDRRTAERFPRRADRTGPADRFSSSVRLSTITIGSGEPRASV